MSGDREVLIFGIDGATFDLLDRWVEEGELPLFARLLKEGVSSECRSTLPPITGPAWASFQTGVNPGKHGIFDWGSSDEDRYGAGVVDATDLCVPTIWELASEAGKRVGAIGVPVTYPPVEVNGFITSGVLTPNGADDYAYPQNLKGELEREVGRYVFAPTHAEMAINTSSWIRSLKGTVKNKEETALHLLGNRDWDLGMVYFMETDTVKHHLYHTIEGSDCRASPRRGAGLDRPVLQIYKRVEKAIRRIIAEVADPETVIVLASDHGFGPLDWIFNVNSWLLREGYLKLKDSPFSNAKKLLQRVGFNQKNLYQLGNLLGPLGKGKEWDMDGFQDILGRMFLSMDDIDWKRTEAFSRGGVTGEIRFNLKGREPLGCVEPDQAESLRARLIEDLQGLRSPFTGEKVIEKIMSREEIYSGPMASLGPDLLFTTKDMRTDTGGLTVFKTLDSLMPAFAISGTHRMNGIFAASGPPLRRESRFEGMDLTDVAPTLLYLLGIDIPDYMDGQVQEDIFLEEFLGERNYNFVHRNIDAKGGGAGGENLEAEEGEGEEVRRRLKNLGYLA